MLHGINDDGDDEDRGLGPRQLGTRDMTVGIVGPHERFTVLDRLAVVMAGFNLLGLLLFPIAGRSFAGMFEDLGSRANLPLLTRLATSTWFPLALALPVAASLVIGLQARRPLPRRRAWVVGAFVLGGLAFGLCVVGMYLPIFAIAGALKME